MTTERLNGSRRGRLVLQLTTGALTGAVGAYLALSAIDRFLPEELALDQLVAVVVGLVYILMGAIVALGTLNPALGARLLNVADSDELRDDRPYLLMAGACCAVMGLALFIVLLAGSDGGGPIGRPTALVLLGLSLLLIVATWRKSCRGLDEFRSRVSGETSNVSLSAVLLVFGGWAALASMGSVAMFTPLAFLAGSLGLILLAAFAVAAKKGLLTV